MRRSAKCLTHYVGEHRREEEAPDGRWAAKGEARCSVHWLTASNALRGIDVWRVYSFAAAHARDWCFLQRRTPEAARRQGRRDRHPAAAGARPASCAMPASRAAPPLRLRPVARCPRRWAIWSSRTPASAPPSPRCGQRWKDSTPSLQTPQGAPSCQARRARRRGPGRGTQAEAAAAEEEGRGAATAGPQGACLRRRGTPPEGRGRPCCRRPAGAGPAFASPHDAPAVVSAA